MLAAFSCSVMLSGGRTVAGAAKNVERLVFAYNFSQHHRRNSMQADNLSNLKTLIPLGRRALLVFAYNLPQHSTIEVNIPPRPRQPPYYVFHFTGSIRCSDMLQ